MTGTRRFAAAMAAALGMAIAGAATAKDKITFAYLIDPSHEAAFWALKNGKVSSERIDIELTPLAIPALIQATVAKQYDVVMTAVIAVPRALSRGLPLKVIGTGLRYHEDGEGAGIWVKADSPIRNAADLKGKTIGVYSLQSTGITLVRIALWKKFGLDVGYENGDMKWVQLPAPSLPAALASGNVDAATLIHAQSFKAQKSDELRTIVETAPINFDIFGVRPISAVYAAYPERLEKNPEAYKEFLRVLKASVDYALAHPDEVFTAAGKATKTDPAFFKTWFSKYSSIPVAVSKDDVAAMQKVWELSKELGLLKSYPDASSVVWPPALAK